MILEISFKAEDLAGLDDTLIYFDDDLDATSGQFC